MNPELYQRLASRTECDQLAALYRMADGGKCEAHLENGNTLPIRVNHAVIGLMGEVGELASAVEKWIYYGGKLDVTNMKEEAGDCLWYLAQLLNALGLDMGEVMFSNIMKLKARFPEKFSTWESANRDLVAERRALEGTHAGLPRAEVVSDPKPGRDWGCSCGKVNAPYDKECGDCGRASPLVSGNKSGELPPVQPHSSHEWDSDKVNAQCLKCEAYKHLGSGFLRCRGTARVDDQPRQQNGHGWSESEVMEGEY